MQHAKAGLVDAGATWHRWDPHLHAPGTLLNDQYHADWTAFLARVNAAAPTIEALGVTDYFCIRGYQQAREHHLAGRLPNVKLLFPNVEMRLEVKTDKDKGINLHLLFSPEDPDHEAQILRVLSFLEFEINEVTHRCTPQGLAAIGRAHSGKPLDDDTAMSVGANAFKIGLSDLRRLMKDRWATENCLVAVAASSNDGTAGLQGDSSFAALRQQIERFAQVIFSATPSTRDFWLGKGKMAAEEVERRFRFLKPCLHGSDAHDLAKVGNPNQDRYTWLKGEVSFESLRQAVIEPEERVSIGQAPPKFGIESQTVATVRTTGAPWLKNGEIPLNPGLVTIIGARGSGKTALVDILAAGAGALAGHLSQSSFLRRASHPVDLVSDAGAQLQWGDGSQSTGPLSPGDFDEESDNPEVCYLSQQFVDGLCSSAGLAVELRRELERVVFEAITPVDQLGAENFQELARLMFQPLRLRQQSLRDRIESLSQRIGQEDVLKRGLAGLKQRHTTASEQLAKLKKELAGLVPKGQEERAKRLQLLETAHSAKEQLVIALRQRQKRLADLADHVNDIRQSREPQRWEAMRSDFSGAAIPAADWPAFKMAFVGDVDEAIRTTQANIAVQITKESSADPAVVLDGLPLEPWPLQSLAAAVEEARKKVGIDVHQQKRYTDLSRKVKLDEAAIAKLGVEIELSNGAEVRRLEAVTDRRAAYVDIFRELAREEDTLRDLYKPLELQLDGAVGALAKLKLVVYRNVDLGSWAAEGEALIDRRVGEKLKGKGTLEKKAEEYFRKAWSKGSAEEVAQAMEDFRTEFGPALVESIPSNVTVEERSQAILALSTWLYDTRHIRVEYGIEYDGVAIEQLSPGTRGIVLLLLYLALDTKDTRPLIVDQPEENLDPQSVYDELVPHFRSARRRRQVIVVTHNANLVVNTDADQVIVASAQRSGAPGLPDITYTGGTLERKDVREAVCNILEGGHRAFLERERRYRFRWDDMVESVPDSSDPGLPAPDVGSPPPAHADQGAA